MKLVFNDSTEITIQSANESSGYLKVKIIAMTRENILALFKDEEKVSRMIVKENRDSTVYERYKYESLREWDGGIYEVSMVQEGKSLDERVTSTEDELTSTQEALCEVYEMIEGLVNV
mgnify:FL=1